MGALWVVFVAALCVLGSANKANSEPCNVEPVAPSSPSAPPCVSQMVEKVPAGVLLPNVAGTIEEVILPVAPKLIGSPANAPLLQSVFAPYPPSMVVPQYPYGFAVSSPPPVAAPCDPNPPCAAPAPNPAPCDADGNPLPTPTPLSFPLPVPRPFPSSSIFSLLSQAQNGDPNEALAQISKFLASTLPNPQLQAAAAAVPPPQDPSDVPAANPPVASPPHKTSPVPVAPNPALHSSISYLPPPPSILTPQKLEPCPAEAGYSQPLDLATLAILEQQASRGLITLSPEIQAQINQASVLSCNSPASIEAAPAPSPFELPKFGQATSQFLNPWAKSYDPYRRFCQHRFL